MLYKKSKIVFSRLIFIIYEMGIQWVKRSQKELQEVTKGYKGLQGVTRGYKGLKGVTEGYKGLKGITGSYKGLEGVTGSYKGFQGVTRSDKALQGVTNDYRNFFLTRTSPDTFSWSILHKNQSSRNLKFLPKTMD